MKILSTASYTDLRAEQAQLRARVAWFERLVERLQSQVDHERARAERAIDAQLSVRGFPMVTPQEDRGIPDVPDELAEDPEKVDAMVKRIQEGDMRVFTEPR
jgi:uncharacterized protein YdcH (DUF465 family)